MTHTDPIADLLIRIKNAYLSHHVGLIVPYSKVKEQVAKVLEKEGYLKEVKVKTKSKKIQKELDIKLLYVNGKSVLTQMKRESKPGLRKYSSSSKLPRVLSGKGLAIITTSKGIMTAEKAKKEKIGGEIICTVW